MLLMQITQYDTCATIDYLTWFDGSDGTLWYVDDNSHALHLQEKGTKKNIVVSSEP